MKKTSFFIVALLSGFVMMTTQMPIHVFAQTQHRTAKDRELSGRIRALTDRSTDGLTETRTARGAISIDLEDRFQNVMLSQIDTNGEPVAACVTSVEEANDFFGRNLETGEIIIFHRFSERPRGGRSASRNVAERIRIL